MITAYDLIHGALSQIGVDAINEALPVGLGPECLDLLNTFFERFSTST